MKRILSIDFDYFINADLETREHKFPDGVDDIPEEELKRQWSYFYDKYPEINDLGVIYNYVPTCITLSSLKSGKVLVAESHRDIAKLFPLIESEEEIEVLHVDYHHDNYVSGGNEVDCANWVRHLKDLIPNAHIKWVRRPDSETASLMGEFPYQHTEKLNIEGEFDYIFLCFSPEWTPPHFRIYFEAMKRFLSHLEHIK